MDLKDRRSRLAFDVAEKTPVQHRLNGENKLEGRDWLEGFMKRFPDLGLRQTARNEFGSCYWV